MSGILAGTKIVDLSRILAGPFSTQMLSDLGAEVIKVEAPWGDDTRKWGPPFTTGFDGNTSSFSIPLTEHSGWLKDPKNTLKDWVIPTKCEFIQMLSGISSIRILGDFTTWYETVSIDNVRIVLDSANGRYQLPVCAQSHPRVLRCDCK